MSVVGINFGNSFASIAVISSEGSAECIANEDGERQVATAISFHGEELYIGNQATPQLIKNAANTIAGFRDLLGLKYSEIPSATIDPLVPSAAVIEHPTLPDTPCYSVQVLVPAPEPLPVPVRNTPVSSRPSTQNPTPLATPRSEPLPQTRLITPHDAAVIFLRSIAQSATDFLGVEPVRTVITAPRIFSRAQLTALTAAASEAGLQNVHLLGEDAAAAAILPQNIDRTALLVDWGATHLAARVLCLRAGLAIPLGGAEAPAPRLAEPFVRHFAAEFSKKTGEKLQVCPPPTPAAQRSQTKLALAFPAVARALTAQRPAQLSVESLAGGIDFSTPLRSARASLLLQDGFKEVVAVVQRALDAAARGSGDDGVVKGSPLAVDIILWVGGAGHWGTAELVPLHIPSLQGVQLEDIGTPEEVLARGCALYASNLGKGTVDVVDSSEATVHAAVAQGAHIDVRVTRRNIGLLVPNVNPPGEPNGHAAPVDEELGGTFIPVLAANTPLPARRTARFGVSRGAAFACEVWEAGEVIQVKEDREAEGDDEETQDDDVDDDDDGEKPLPRKVVKHSYLGALVVPLAPVKGTATQSKKSKSKSKSDSTRIIVRVDVSLSGEVVVACREDVSDDTNASEKDGWVVLKA